MTEQDHRQDLPRLRRHTGIGLALWAALSLPVQAQDAVPVTDNYQIVGGVAAYLGLMPAEIVGGHQRSHPESQMHGGPPDSPHAEHVVVALFDDPAGTRIEDATVTATISGVGHVAITPISLDPMLIAGVITYGGYMTFPGRDTYSIDLQITTPGKTMVTRMRFAYDHGGN